MNTLYYEIEDLKSTGIIYGEVEIPENVISLNAVRKKDGIFLQYITTANRKIVKRFKRYIVHDENNSVKVGDVIEAIECKPISKRKAFTLHKVVSVGVELWFKVLQDWMSLIIVVQKK